MAMQAGRDLLLKLDDPTNPGTFITVAGLRTTSLRLSSSETDATHADSTGRWRELLAGTGVKRLTVSGSGVFKDDASDAAVRDVALQQATPDWQLILPDFAQFEGPFMISDLTWSGVHDAELRFSMTLASAGALTVTTL